jgi:hypothetical protein
MKGMLRITLLSLCTVALAACGSGGGGAAKATTTTSSAPALSTTIGPQASIEVRPPSGAVGASFELVANRFQPGEKVVFEIDAPDGKTFKGQAHTATAAGSVNATYKTGPGNPAGTYKVRATGDRGTQSAGNFQLTSVGGATTIPGGATTVPTHTSTTTATTKKP